MTIASVSPLQKSRIVRCSFAHQTGVIFAMLSELREATEGGFPERPRRSVSRFNFGGQRESRCPISATLGSAQWMKGRRRAPRRPRRLAGALAVAACALVASLPAVARGQGAGPGGGERVSRLDLPPEAERAIDSALVYLAANQNGDGSWGVDKYYVANTAINVMAFMVQGHVPGKGKYGGHIQRGIDYLLNRARVRNDGYIVGPESSVMYQHCLAVMALAEAWGQSKSRRIGPVVKAGTEALLRTQHEEGGWRYDPRPTKGDISVTIMAIEALVSAKESGVLVPDRALEKARRFLHNCQDEKGRFGYTPTRPGTNSYRMGAGLLGLALTGERDSERVERAWSYLRGPAMAKGWALEPRDDWLDQFYCVQACYQAGDEQIRFWYPRIAQTLLRAQQPSGRIGASPNLPHAATGVAVLILGVPYRYLPIFQR